MTHERLLAVQQIKSSFRFADFCSRVLASAEVWWWLNIERESFIKQMARTLNVAVAPTRKRVVTRTKGLQYEFSHWNMWESPPDPHERLDTLGWDFLTEVSLRDLAHYDFNLSVSRWSLSHEVDRLMNVWKYFFTDFFEALLSCSWFKPPFTVAEMRESVSPS